MHQKRRRPKVEKDRKEAAFFTPARAREKAMPKTTHAGKSEVEVMIEHWSVLRGQLTQSGEYGDQCRSRCRELGRRELGSGFKDCQQVLLVLQRLTEYLATLKSKKESKTGGEVCFKELLKAIALPELTGNTNAYRDGETQLARWQRFLELLPQYLPRKPRVITASPIHRHYRREEEVVGGVENFLRRLGRNFRFRRDDRNNS